uniref:Uncharacterized protein n=1 Tax=Pseudomonas phage HRDY3 TaxID=3236930 RepID=A0AB39CEY2_9VIRU
MGMLDDAYIERRTEQDGVKIFYFAAHAGAHIASAAASALGQMFYKAEKYGNDKVAGFIEFNDLMVPLKEGDKPEDVHAEYKRMSDERRAQYEKTDEFKRREQEAAQRAVANQVKLNETVNKIEALCADWSKRSQLQPNGQEGADLFGLLITYIDAADYIGVEKHADRVRIALESVGYWKNQYSDPRTFGPEGSIQHQAKYRAYAAGMILNMIGMINPHLGPKIEEWELHLLH